MPPAELPSLPPAPAADIFRAALKDEEYIAGLTADLAAVLSDLPRPYASSPQLPALVPALARLLYTATALCRGPRRTPGDEYVAVLPLRAAAPLAARAAVTLAALRAAARPAARAAARALWRVAAPEARRRAFPAHAVDAALAFADRAHLAAFYMVGLYYGVANRALRVRYVRTSVPLFEEEAGNRYQLLGVLLAVQLAVSAGRAVRAAVRRARRRRRSGGAEGGAAFARAVVEALVYPHGGAGGVDEDSDEEEAAAPVPAPAAAAAPAPAAGRRNCPLCLGRLKTPTLTTCGHVFCWHCVASWCAQAKDQCPLCRHPVQMHRDLVALSNY